MLKAFISYPYVDSAESFVALLRRFLSAHDVDIVDGKFPDATEALNKSILQRIQACQILVSYLPDGSQSHYVDQEIGVALGSGLDVIVVGDGLGAATGLTSHLYRISRSDGDLAMATAMSSTLNAIKKRRNIDPGPPLSQNAPEDELVAEGWTEEVRREIYSLRAAFRGLRFGWILDETDRLARTHTECWRFLIAKSSALIHLRRYGEASNVLDAVASRFGTNSRAMSYVFQNRGWHLSRSCPEYGQDVLQREIDYHRCSLACEKRVIEYINLICCLLRQGDVAAAESALIECLGEYRDTVAAFKDQVAAQGADFVSQIAKSRLLSALLFPKEVSS
jgi:hypothetical protein